MGSPITVTFSGELAEKIHELASRRRQTITTLVESLVDQAWPGEDVVARDDAATPEMQAYLVLHPILKQQYLGQYIALYQGNLVDHDRDHDALYRRIDAQYPDESVWISLVEEEAIPTLKFHSPRIEWNRPL